MNEAPYMSEPWFALLLQQVEVPGATQASIARQLGISAVTLNMVLRGTGPYGAGQADTHRVADRVIHTFGRYVCPHLTAEAGGVEQVITAEQCRAYAHRPPPTTPRELRHWQACQQCPHRAASAPPVPRPVVARKRATPDTSNTPTPGDSHDPT
ncbi:hypothetical protein [Ottowia sp.]|uniref:hypothetical protein n=1 Tax=Ottowia sp. TaxID=1898956 RepID=UPI0025E0DB0A|nr:hypothetical protein [Ottowia sp.]